MGARRDRPRSHRRRAIRPPRYSISYRHRSPFLIRKYAGPIGRFATTMINQNPRRSSLTIAMIGVGLGSVIWLSVIAESFERTAVATFSEAMQADLVVSSANISSGYLELPLDDSIMNELQAVDGVRSVIGIRVTDWDYKGGPIAIDAFDPLYFSDPATGRWPLFGKRIPRVWEKVASG